ncbi:hypothetical protein RB653_004540 [Dictyostelium firmibasis]|uniref:Uncharacterized protein n=1 Tax=Dictyostelium firmibasis TaxID=79012 RepID=A0AAN7Z3F2_9MYCE
MKIRQNILIQLENTGLKTEIDGLRNENTNLKTLIEELQTSIADLLVKGEQRNKATAKEEKQLIAYANSSSMANYYLENILLPELELSYKTANNSKLFKWSKFKFEFNKHIRFVEYAKKNHQVNLEEIRKLKEDLNDIIHDGEDEVSINDIVVTVEYYTKHLNAIEKSWIKLKLKLIMFMKFRIYKLHFIIN